MKNVLVTETGVSGLNNHFGRVTTTQLHYDAGNQTRTAAVASEGFTPVQFRFHNIQLYVVFIECHKTNIGSYFNKQYLILFYCVSMPSEIYAT